MPPAGENSLGAGTVGKPARGRPVCFLGASWFYNAYDPGNDSRYFHVHAKPLPTLQQRQDARGVVATVAASCNIFGKELPRRDVWWELEPGEPNDPP